MSATPRPSVARPAKSWIGDLVISLVFLVVFVAALKVALGWPFKARLFPEMIAVAGIVFVGLKLAGLGLWILRRDRGDQAVATPATGSESDDDEIEDFSVEYVFGTATRREWVTALAWIGAFFVALYVLGIFVTVPAFALAYLRFAGGVGWLAAAIYAAVAGGVIWLGFYYLLYVPMPAGIF